MFRSLCPVVKKRDWSEVVGFLNVFGVLDFSDDSNVAICASDSLQLSN